MTTRRQVEAQAKKLRAVMTVSTSPELDVEIAAPPGKEWAEMGTSILVASESVCGSRADVWDDLAMRMDSGLRNAS